MVRAERIIITVKFTKLIEKPWQMNFHFTHFHGQSISRVPDTQLTQPLRPLYRTDRERQNTSLMLSFAKGRTILQSKSYPYISARLLHHFSQVSIRLGPILLVLLACLLHSRLLRCWYCRYYHDDASRSLCVSCCTQFCSTWDVDIWDVVVFA